MDLHERLCTKKHTFSVNMRCFLQKAAILFTEVVSHLGGIAFCHRKAGFP